jgi:signal transduction histidine kinase
VIDDNGETTHFIGVQNDITQIVQLKQQRDDFVATLVHDLKNPMIACNRILELIIEGTIDAGDQGNLLERIHESNLTMLRMISNTLDYYRCEAGPFQPVFQVFDLSGLCRRVIDEFRLHAKSKSIALQSDYPESLPILGDENLLRRVLVNLIDNAMKFTCKDGRVALIVEHDVNAMIKVVNTGAGLSAEEISTVFDRFVQAKAGKRYSNSSGLGLFFCRQIIEAHGGTIECQSNSGETEFRFTLPISA